MMRTVVRGERMHIYAAFEETTHDGVGRITMVTCRPTRIVICPAREGEECTCPETDEAPQ